MSLAQTTPQTATATAATATSPVAGSLVTGTTMESPRIFHDREYKGEDPHPKYVRTIAYHLDLAKGELVYGATVFHRTHSNDKWCRKNHIVTARKRFTESPVIVAFDPPESDCIPDFFDFRRREETILHCLFEFGTTPGKHLFKTSYENWYDDETVRPPRPDRTTGESWWLRELTPNERFLMWTLFGAVGYLAFVTELMYRYN